MNISQTSIKKARVVLKRIGHITDRLKARKFAHETLQKHIQKIKDRPSNKKFDDLNLLINEAISEEVNLAKCDYKETERVKELKELIHLLKNRDQKQKNKIARLEKENKDYKKLKLQAERREKALDKKINQSLNQDMKEKLKNLEQQYKKYQKVLPKTKLDTLKKRIQTLKNKIK